jgi:tetratricopeptide (TPR) repeat protein
MKALILFLLLLLLFLAPGVVFCQHRGMPIDGMENPAALVSGLGHVSHPVSTKNALAQKFFNQGLAYIYAFNHDEAVKAFKRAAELDPGLAMAYWGVALARGSNYNVNADKDQLKEAWENLQKAGQLAPKASASDRAYIQALSKRYSADENADQKQLSEYYTAAMKDLTKKYPNDLDAATLYAESMMNLRPWQLWTLDGQPAPGTLEIVAVLESVLKRNPNHIGANHYYIHAVEASPEPDKALPSARRIARLAPNAGHLVHMPSHIYIRTGDYTQAAKNNSEAIVADKNYMKKNGSENLYSTMYYNHNVHFLASSSAMIGRYADAIKAARELETNVTPMLKQMPMLQMFALYPTAVQVRFHKWEDILKLSAPPEDVKVKAAFWHFARGLAFAKTEKIDEAEKELSAMRDSVKTIPANIPYGYNSSADIMKVAENLLSGEIALTHGDKAKAIELLRAAAEAEDKINYDEPPDWDIPVREWLGNALLTAGNYSGAEAVYRDELEKHRHNGRALFGLMEALNKQKKTTEANKIKLEFTRQWAGADTKLIVADLYK